MALPILKVKRSEVASSVPSLTYGEIGVNITDGVLYVGNSSNSAVELGNYTTPTQYKILDPITFDGTTTAWTISSGSTNFLNSEIDSSARLMISVGGIVQQPNLQAGSDGFYISGGTNLTTDPIQINFFEAPAANEAFFGVAYGLSEVPSVSAATNEQAIAYSIVFGV